MSKETTENFILERRYLKNVTQKTIIWYGSSFKAFEGALDSTESVKSRIIELRNRGVSPVSVNTYLRCIKAYYRWLGKEWIIPRLQVEQKILRTLSAEDIQVLIHFKPTKFAERRTHILTLLILDTGLRISEALSLKRDSIDLDKCTLRILGKGNKERIVPFSLELRKRLFKHVQKMPVNRSGVVFGTCHGTVMTVTNFFRDLRLMGCKCGVAVGGPHSLRHCFAVNYLRRGGNLEYLRRILGHSSISTTQIYLRSVGIEDLQAVHSELSVLSG
jgi:integrase/recombinase XerD